VHSKADSLGDLVQAVQLCTVAFVCSCSVCRAAAGPPSRARRVRCAPVPPRAALPAGAPRSARDFVTANAVRAILARPPAPALGPPRYARRPGFGRAPGYLARARAKAAAECVQLSAHLQTQQQQARCTQLHISNL